MSRSPILYALLTALLAGGALAQDPEEPAAARLGHQPAPGHDHALRHEGPPDHSFADAEAWAERFESAERDEYQMPDRVVGALGIGPGMSVADIGSGTGYFARRFAEAVGPSGTVYAADVEPEMAVYVRRRADEDGQGNLVPVLASYDDPRLPDGSVDLVFICNTWHHIANRVDYARRLAGDLAPGGRVAIVDFLPGDLPVGPGPEHKLSAEEVTAELEEAGYSLTASPDFLPYQYVLVFEAPEPSAGTSLRILLRSGSEKERQAEAQLRRLLAEHDVERWLFTREVLIDETAPIPHSHPLLTLNAGGLENDLAELATLLHEQFHWFALEDQKRLGDTIGAFRELFPEVPSRGGARNESSTYLHLVICDLELQAMTGLVGEEKAREIIGGWNHYSWIYEQVLTHPEVRRINERFGMVAP